MPPVDLHSPSPVSTRRRMLTRATALALTASLTVGLTAGCSLFGGTPDPTVTAKALADSLSSGTFTDVTLSGTSVADAQKFLTAAYKGVAPLRPTVQVTDVVTSGDDSKATATLQSTWDVSDSDHDWTYETQVPLVRNGSEWEVPWDPDLVAPELTRNEVLDTVHTWPKRADILDRNSTPIMTEREVALVGIDKTKVSAKEAAASATQLARIVGINPTTYAAKVASAGDKAFVPAITFRSDDPVLTTNADRIDKVKGALSLPRLQVLGPTRTWAAPILGTVSEATAEQIEKSDGQLRPGDVVGQNGLQARYDKELRGTPGLSIRAVEIGADGSTIGKRELFSEVSVPGKPLQLTLDTAAQTAAEAALAGQTGKPTSLVVVEPSTGDILAAAVGPGAKGSPLALAGRNAPGSTFKMVSSLGIIRAGGNADTLLPCTPTLTVNGRVFGNYTNYPKEHLGDIPLKTAFAQSCNTAFISQRDKVSQDDLISAAASLGIGEDLELDFTGFLGSVPPTDDVVEHAATFIGQGRVEASPMAMAIAVASIMKGATVRPRLLADAKELPPPATPLTAAEAQILRTEMITTVKEGSGKVLEPAGVQYAKTGTAEFGTTNPPKTHAWMVAGLGDLAIAAYNDEGENGVTGAAPFILSFLKSYPH